jgi:hypothetical protein
MSIINIITPIVAVTSISSTAPVSTNSSGQITTIPSMLNGQIPIGNTGSTPVVGYITPVSLQTTVTNGAGTITIGTAQNIAATSSPTFAAMNLTNGTSRFGGAIQEFQGPFITLDNTTHTFYTLTCAANQTYHAEYLIYCYCETSGVGDGNKVYNEKAYYKISGNGVAAESVQIYNAVEDGTLGVSQSTSVSGNEVSFQYTGVTSDSIFWGIYLIIYSF